MIKNRDLESRSLDLDAAGVDVDIQNRVLEAAGALRGDAHRFIADFLEAWHRDPEMIRTEMRKPLSLDGLSLRVGDALPAPLVIADAQITRMKYPPDAGRARQEALDDVADLRVGLGPMDLLERLGLSLDQINKVKEAAYSYRWLHADGADGFVSDFIAAYKKDPETMLRAFSDFEDVATPGVPADLFRPKAALGTGPAKAPPRGFVADAERTLLHPDAERRRLNRELVTDVDDAARDQFSGAVVYLFGAIAKDPEYKRRFAAAQRYCERWGMTVLNPTRHPVPASGPLPVDFYMRHCLIDVEVCEVMVPVPSPFLDGSAGAAVERAYGECLQKPILDGFVKEV